MPAPKEPRSVRRALSESPGRSSERSRKGVRQRAFRCLVTVGLLLLASLVAMQFVPPDVGMPPMVYAALIVLFGLGAWYEFKVFYRDGRNRPRK